MESLRKSGVPIAWFHCSGVGRSTTTPRSSTAVHEVLEAFVAALDGSERAEAPHAAHLGINGHLLGGRGLLGRNHGVVAAATMTRFSGSQSFQELTILAIIMTPFLKGALLYP